MAALLAYGCPEQVLTDNGRQFTGKYSAVMDGWGQQVDFLVYAGLFLPAQNPRLVKLLRARADAGADIDPMARGVGWLLAEGGTPQRVKAAYLSDADVAALAAHAARLRASRSE